MICGPIASNGKERHLYETDSARHGIHIKFDEEGV
jgi:hypothetical protein